ncbi:Serine protease inhibitor SERPIN family protein [Prunus dulcis]|uniref:Serine protease inhibitor SERPIN family protein n=1 Tax=Prunus dulcis TaxID=3755 RepID=A0A4Y1RIA3_PRUDU|nr:Serine protease inhibitor SERPIN family protein [Prunus dulcis]
MAKVRRALNIPPRFHEWRWLLSGYREEDGGLPPVEDVERWKQNGPDPDDLLGGQEECSAESLSKRKAATKSPRGEATSSHAKDRRSPNSPPMEGGVEEQVAGEDDAEVMVQADGVADDVASQADAEEAAA